MPMLTQAEEKQLQQQKEERLQIILKFRDEFLVSFIMGIKICGIAVGAIIVLYLLTKWVFKWDLFYETDLNYSSIFFVITVIFFLLVLLCWIVAFILYNTKHVRNTKYSVRNNE